MTEKLNTKMNNIDKKLDKMQKEMEDIWTLINEMKAGADSKKHKNNKIVVIDEKSKWKKEMYRQAKTLINAKCSFRKKSEVLHYIYAYMRRNYGIVWEQDVKEYKEHFETEYKPKTIDIVYENKMYRSIFEAVLADLIVNASDGIVQSKSN